MTPTPTPAPDLATQWNSARRLYPMYFELAREFAIEVKACPELETGGDTPAKESVDHAAAWLEELDEKVQVHQMRQFLQTNSLVTVEAILNLLQHFLAKQKKSDAVRDKIDFLLVQYFSQIAPTGVDDAEVDLGYVAQALQPVLGQVDIKPPVWLNALDRVLESARRVHSLDDLLHGGVLEQGRKAKTQAGDLFYMPVALVAFTRFGYLMRRTFFRLMLGDLNIILDGLSELESKGIETLDCRRAQFSAQEPILRLRMICQSWKVMFQAEYSSGQPLRMLVDLRASVEQALGRGKPAAEIKDKNDKAEASAKAAPAKASPAKEAAVSNSAAGAGKTPAKSTASAKPAPSAKANGATAPTFKSIAKPAAKPVAEVKTKAKAASVSAGSGSDNNVPEFEISSVPGWGADDSDSQPK